MKQILKILILLLSLLMVACNSGSSGSSNSSHSPVVNPSPQPSTSPAASPFPSPTPSVTPSPQPSPTPGPQPVVGHYLYVLNFSTNVERCQLDNESGGLMNCIPTAAGISDALGITLNSARTLAYITNGNGVEECQINVVDGTLNQCISTGSYPLYAYNHYAYSITISPDNSYAYIALDSGTTQCQINKIDGSLYNCTWFPAAVGLSGGIKASLNSNFLYVSGNIFSGGGIVNSTLGVIGINSTIGTIESSIQYYSLPGGLYLMAFNKTGTYLYVSNNNSITQCQINNTTGVPTNCDQTGTSFVTPDGIAFDESNDYAYVANSQSTTVTRCQVSSTDGSFSNCIQSPSLFNRPIDLAYY